MAWQAWVAIWAVLLVGALLVLVAIGLSLWRRLKDVAHEVEIASDRFALISEQLEKLQPPAPEPAIFDDATRLRRERDRAVRQARAMTEMRIRARAARASEIGLRSPR